MELKEKYFHLVKRARQNASNGLIEMVREQPARLQDERTPLADLMEFIIKTAVAERASDVHFEPLEQEVRIRLRINGCMKQFFQDMPWELYGNLLSRLKIMCGLDIAEKRLPQDGRFSFMADGSRMLDIRVSIVPMINGEKIVLRLLNNQESFKGIEQLDFTSRNYELLRQKCTSGHGAVLLSGPVNSGKTTDLYAILSMLNQEGRNIISIEDPVEYRIEGINQIQINEKIGYTFEMALRAVLRQDFDCLAVGELRNAETADMMITSALTGRRVFATLHTPGAVKTIFRLLDMGIKPYLLASAISLVVGQRLVKRLCPCCREAYFVQKESGEGIFLGDEYRWQSDRFFKHREGGCAACNYTGYAGRIAVQELLSVEGDVAEAVMNNVKAEDLEAIAMENGMIGMKQDGIAKAALGYLELTELMEIF